MEGLPGASSTPSCSAICRAPPPSLRRFRKLAARARLSDTAGAHRCRLSGRRSDRHFCAPDGPMAVASASGRPSWSRIVPAPAARSASRPSSPRRPTAIRCFWSAPSAVISASYYKNLSFNIMRDIAPVCGISLEPLVMVVNPSVPAKTVPEFIAYAKANPGKIVMASVGNGTTPHLAGELFKLMAKVDLLHVPYQGAAPALTDLLGGRADVMFEAMPTLVGYIKYRQACARWAWAPTTRSPVFPELSRHRRVLARLRGDRLVRHRRAEEDAGRDRRAPQQGNQRRSQRSDAAARGSSRSAACRSPAAQPISKNSLSTMREKWAKVMREANIKPE